LPGRSRTRAAAAAAGKAAREQGEAALEELPFLRERFASRDRVFPAFLPAFHAPDVARAGGWDVVIMNPPYVGRKEVARLFDRAYLADLERHYGRTYDLMIHFGFRAFELARPGGIVSMIFNDSIFTSLDATDFRCRLLAPDGPITVLAVARTRCFVGRAVNGGVVVAVEAALPDRALRYVENHGRPPTDLTGASVAAEATTDVGRSELWIADRSDYLRLPHRPLFRPSRPRSHSSTASRSALPGTSSRATGISSPRRAVSTAGARRSGGVGSTSGCASDRASCCSAS